jgi:hypothetical protein
MAKVFLKEFSGGIVCGENSDVGRPLQEENTGG